MENPALPNLAGFAMDLYYIIQQKNIKKKLILDSGCIILI